MTTPILIACDGSSHKKADKTMGGAIGWAWARDDGHWMSGAWFEGTNQRAELHAIRSVLLFHPKGHIKVQMDSQYALNVTSKWARGWARRNWTKADMKPIANLDIIKEIHDLTMRRTDPIEYMWVKGHRKDNAFPLNTMADVRCGEASARAKLVDSSEDSIKLYLDSKGRTSMKLEEDMLRKIYAL
jgi:ribonuclease HI